MDGCCKGEDSNGGGHLPFGLDRGRQPATHRSGLSESTPVVLPASIRRNRARQLRVLCYQYGGESESGLEPMGSPANWRCIALEKLRLVKLVEDSWKTA